MAQTISLDALLQRTGRGFGSTTLSRILRELPSLDEKGPWIAGGAVRRTVAWEEPDSDFDFFFSSVGRLKDFEDFLRLKLHAKKIQERPHQITYEVNLTRTRSSVPRRIQLIRFKYYESAEDVIENFDFTICQFAFDGTTLTTGDHSMWDLAKKQLVLNKVTYPISTMRRLMKYQTQGFFAGTPCLEGLLTQSADIMANEIMLAIGRPQPEPVRFPEASY